MKTWGFGINSRPEWRKGHVDLEERPWWIALVEWFAFWVNWSWLSRVKLPDWPKIAWEGADVPCSPREWWGDLGQVVNVAITNPLYQWVWKHPRNIRRTIDLGYEKTKEVFYHGNEDFFDDEDGRHVKLADREEK